MRLTTAPSFGVRWLSAGWRHGGRRSSGAAFYIRAVLLRRMGRLPSMERRIARSYD